MNFHLYPKYDQIIKKANLAALYDDIMRLQKEGKINVDPRIKELLQAESFKRRHRNTSGIMTRELREAAKQLRENNNIVIRRADKATTYVILDREDYLMKCRTILADNSKFERITRNTTEELKKRTNNLISAANALVGGIKFEKATGDFNPGYFYGNVKTHKAGNPLRPIISQIPTPTYTLAKQINAILTPYVPTTYSINSTKEFIDLIKINRPNHYFASLDVASLFTNVPVRATIDILLNYAYNHESMPQPKVPRAIMREMLEACTLDSPFRCPEGQLYKQTDGVAMGSPLGVLFAQSYMAHKEEQVLNRDVGPTFIYCRYVDDVFVGCENTDILENLKIDLEQASGLNFTIESSEGNKLPFLDVLVEHRNDEIIVSVYRKPTNIGVCMNGNSECCDRYKKSVVRSYIRRAIVNSSTWMHFDSEMKHIRQMVVNNGFSNSVFDDVANGVIDAYIKSNSNEQEQCIKVYYENQFTDTYKADERALKTIVDNNCKPVANGPVKLIVYYKNPTTSSKIMRNNLSAERGALTKANVVYRYTCNHEDCEPHNVNYVGQTQCTLSRRITYHLQGGGNQGAPPEISQSTN